MFRSCVHYLCMIWSWLHRTTKKPVNQLVTWIQRERETKRPLDIHNWNSLLKRLMTQKVLLKNRGSKKRNKILGQSCWPEVTWVWRGDGSLDAFSSDCQQQISAGMERKQSYGYLLSHRPRSSLHTGSTTWVLVFVGVVEILCAVLSLVDVSICHVNRCFLPFPVFSMKNIYPVLTQEGLSSEFPKSRVAPRLCRKGGPACKHLGCVNILMHITSFYSCL